MLGIIHVPNYGGWESWNEKRGTRGSVPTEGTPGIRAPPPGARQAPPTGTEAGDTRETNIHESLTEIVKSQLCPIPPVAQRTEQR